MGAGHGRKVRGKTRKLPCHGVQANMKVVSGVAVSRAMPLEEVSKFEERLPPELDGGVWDMATGCWL